MLQKVDFQMLYDHPSISALAAVISDLQSAGSDSEDEDPLRARSAAASQVAEEVMGFFFEPLRRVPHAICIEEGSFSASYWQIFCRALAYQRMLRRCCPRDVALRQFSS